MLKKIGRVAVRLIRWRIDGEIPPHSKRVLVAAPHTSNWDFLLAMIVPPALGIRINWLGKYTLFRKPFGWFFRMLGGIPVDRARTTGIVGQSVAAFESTDELNLVITPEGTRRKREYWKSGFYWIALAAKVPIVLVKVDGSNRTVRVGADFALTGQVGADMDRIRKFFEGHNGIKPELAGPVRLRNET